MQNLKNEGKEIKNTEKTIYADLGCSINLELLTILDKYKEYMKNDVYLKPPVTETEFRLSLTLPQKKMNHKAIKSIYNFLKRYKTYCNTLIIIETFGFSDRNKEFRCFCLPFRLKKVTIELNHIKSNLTKLYKNISLMSIDNIYFSSSTGILPSFQKLSVIRDSYKYKSKLNINFTFFIDILYSSFMNNNNNTNLESIKALVDIDINNIITVWMKCQFTKLFQIMEKKHNFIWNTNHQIQQYNHILNTIWNTIKN